MKTLFALVCFFFSISCVQAEGKDLSSLLAAIKARDFALVQKLVEANELLALEKDKDGDTLSLYCTKIVSLARDQKMVTIYKYLIDKRAFVNQKKEVEKLYPLHAAVASKNKLQVYSFLAKNKDAEQLNKLNRDLLTAMDIALSQEKTANQIAIVDLLKRAGGLTAAELVKINEEKAKKERKLEAEQLQQAADLRIKHQAQLANEYPTKYPLHQAVLNYDKPAISKLVASAAVSINTLDCYGCTPCDVAFKLEDPGKGLEIFNLLKAAGGSTSEEVNKFAAMKTASTSEPAWEYRTVFFNDLELILESFDSRINKLGQEGWEVISQRRARSTFPTEQWGVETCLKRKTIRK